MAETLPTWMKKFPPNYQIREIPGVRGFIQEESMDLYEGKDMGQMVGYEILPFFFYLSQYRDDDKGQMSDEEKAELTSKVKAWLKKNDITEGGGFGLVGFGSRGEAEEKGGYAISDNIYWTYLPVSPSLHETWIDYWGGQYPPDNLPTLNWNWKQMQYLIRKVI